MIICELTRELRHEYERFLFSHPSSQFFQSLKYLDLIEEVTASKNITIVATNSEKEIIGVLPLFSKSGTLGDVLNSSPFYGSNGGILANEDNTSHALNLAYDAIIKHRDVAASTIIGNPLEPLSISPPTHTHIDERIGQFTLLEKNQSAESLLTRFHPKTRNMIRKAQHCGVSVTIENDSWDFLQTTHKENMFAIGGKPKSETFFNCARKHFNANDDYQIFTARLGSVKVAALLLFFFKDTVEYFTPVIVNEHRSSQAMSLLIYKSMLELSQRDFRKWNWGGTWKSQDGVYRFKKRWDTVDVEYKYYTQINNRKILISTAEELTNAYPNFFVIPFNALTKTEELL